jgi:purine-binding chemotaxis protein CheW
VSVTQGAVPPVDYQVWVASTPDLDVAAAVHPDPATSGAPWIMSEQSDRQLVVFSLGEEEYAFPIGQVHEIIRRTEPRSVASPDPWVRGIISLRGRIVPVHDLTVRLGVTGGAGEDWKIVILEVDGEVAGVIVDDVEEVLTVQAAQIEAVPAGSDAGIAAVVNLGDRIVALLDPSLVLGTTTPAEAIAPAALSSTPAPAPAVAADRAATPLAGA